MGPWTGAGVGVETAVAIRSWGWESSGASPAVDRTTGVSSCFTSPVLAGGATLF